MSNTLSKILTVFKVLKIISKVVYILCIISGVCCLLALCILPLAGQFLPDDVMAEVGGDMAMAYAALITAVIACVGEAILAFMAERYFGNVLSAGTPFTLDGSKECFRFGILSIAVSLASAVALGIVMGILAVLTADASSLEMETSASFGTGLFFLFLSLVFKHGAEVQASAAPYEASAESYEGAADSYDPYDGNDTSRRL